MHPKKLIIVLVPSPFTLVPLPKRLLSLVSGRTETQQLNKLVPELQSIQANIENQIKQQFLLTGSGSSPQLVIHFPFATPYSTIRNYIIRARRDFGAKVQKIVYVFFDTANRDLAKSNYWLKKRGTQYVLRYPITAPHRASDGKAIEFLEAEDKTIILSQLKNFSFLQNATTVEDIVSRLSVFCQFEAQRITIASGSTSSLYFESVNFSGSDDHYWLGTLRIGDNGSDIPRIPCFSIKPVRSKVLEYVCEREPELYNSLVSSGFAGKNYVSDQSLNHLKFSLEQKMEEEFAVPRNVKRMERLKLTKWPITSLDIFGDEDYDLSDDEKSFSYLKEETFDPEDF